MATSLGWTPSPARTVGPVVAAGTPVRGSRAAAPALSWAAKASVEQLDYALDLSAWLTEAGDSLLSVEATSAPSASPQDLVINWSAPMNAALVVFLSGGVPLGSYMVSLLARTAMGRVALFDVALQITGDAVSPPSAAIGLPPNVLVDASGRVLFLAAATPLLLA